MSNLEIKLPIEASCEIDDLITELMRHHNKTYDEVETAMFNIGLYPESKKTFFTNKFGKIVDQEGYDWIEESLEAILKDYGLTSMYITTAI